MEKNQLSTSSLDILQCKALEKTRECFPQNSSRIVQKALDFLKLTIYATRVQTAAEKFKGT